MGYDDGFAPFTFTGRNGEFVGMGSDYLRLLANRLALKPFIFESGPWADVLSRARAGEIDVLVGVAKTADRQRDLLFVGPWVSSPSAVVAPVSGAAQGAAGASGVTSMAQLRSKRVAVLRDSVQAEYLRTNEPDVQLVDSATRDGVLELLRKREADFAILAVANVLPRLEGPLAQEIRIAGFLPELHVDLYFALPRDRAEVAALIQRALDSLGDADRASIAARWVTLPVSAQQAEEASKRLRAVLPVLLVALLALGVAIAWGMSLRREVRARRAAEATLELSLRDAEALARSRADFVAVASHEIRTPVNAVVGALDRLQRIDAGGLSAAQRELMGLARTAARNLAALVNNLLDLSKVDAGQLALNPSLADLRSDLEAQAATAKAEAAAKSLSFNLLLDSQLAPLLAYDALRLQQVISNLITNALKFTREGGITLEVRVLRDSASAQTLGIAVQDTGIGITSEKAARLFRPYVQADAQVARDFGGTGLGLALCRRLVVAMGGTIGMSSEPGRGTRVEFEVTLDKPGAPAFLDSLPEQLGPGAAAGGAAAAVGMASGAAAGAAAASSPASAASAGLQLQLPQGLRALLVDDDRVQQIVLGAALDELGIAHDTASHGGEALALWQHHGHALIITDIHMPELDGPTLARSLRATPRGAQLTILGTSADLDIRDAAIAAGMNDVILKPASAQSISAWLAAHPMRIDQERV